MLEKRIRLKQHGLEIRTITPADLTPLTALARDPKIWHHQPIPYFETTVFQHEWLEKALEALHAGSRHVFTLIWQGHVAGSSSFYEISHQHKRLSIGYTWHAPSIGAPPADN